MTRRELMAAQAATLAVSSSAAHAQQPKPPTMTAAKMEGLDKAVESIIARQILDKGHKYRGSSTSPDGLNYGSTPSSYCDTLVTALMHPQSRHYKSARVAERLQLAAEAFVRIQTPDGNWNLPTTNFNSPADTAFIIQAMSTTLLNARTYGFPDLEKWVQPAIDKAATALVVGGIHTPNHRWVACSGLAGLHKLYGEPRFLRRIDQWLAETVDIDSDGQYTERSPVTYNGVCNRAFTLMADRLNRPELHDYPRRNLQAMLHLLHADGEVVTEISRRQDLNTRGTMYNHWLSLAYLAGIDKNGQFATLARQLEPNYAPVSWHMAWPHLMPNLPPSQPLPDNFEKVYPEVGLARIRRGLKSVSILRDTDRFFTYRHGKAVVNAVRFSSAFFGKAQFRARTLTKSGASFELKQMLDAGYYQPFEPTRIVGPEEYDFTREQRRRTEISKLNYTATITETPRGAKVRIQADGTDEVPVAVEINLREGGVITGAERSGQGKEAWFLPKGHATFALGGDTIKIGPGRKDHSYIAVRGALPPLDGPSIWITGNTPFDHTLEFEPV